ncbi:MAG: hypothetical protein S0880_00125 [Actinomycetota bacterium]|nr:hypothetical protein [Actinomycetota bacterium]
MSTEPGAVTWTVDSLLGGDSLADVLGHAVDEASPRVQVEPYAFGSPATGALLRLSGTRPDGRSWSAFVKVLQHVRHWPTLEHLPPPAAEAFVTLFPWREELSLWEPPFAGSFPPGTRPPHLFRVVELGDDRVAVWMEEVDADPSPWTVERYARAAGMLGRPNAAALATREAIASTGFEPATGWRCRCATASPGARAHSPTTSCGPGCRPPPTVSPNAVASPASAEEVAAAYAGTLLLRSGFTAIPYDDLGSPQLTRRLALTRFILDAAQRHLG